MKKIGICIGVLGLMILIKVLLDAANDHSDAAKKYLDEKILGLGSPKIDKVLNTRKEDYL